MASSENVNLSMSVGEWAHDLWSAACAWPDALMVWVHIRLMHLTSGDGAELQKLYANYYQERWLGIVGDMTAPGRDLLAGSWVDHPFGSLAMNAAYYAPLWLYIGLAALAAWRAHRKGFSFPGHLAMGIFLTPLFAIAVSAILDPDYYAIERRKLEKARDARVREERRQEDAEQVRQLRAEAAARARKDLGVET